MKNLTARNIIQNIYHRAMAHGGAVAEAMHYKPEGHGIDS
jgi:hypothetical protein